MALKLRKVRPMAEENEVSPYEATLRDLLRKNERLLKTLENTFGLLQQQQQELSSSSVSGTIVELRVELMRLATLWRSYERVDIGGLVQTVKDLKQAHENADKMITDRRTQIIVLFIGQALTILVMIVMAMINHFKV